MAYQHPYSYTMQDNDYDEDTSYHPPSHFSFNPTPRSNGGYQVAPVSSYLPRSPSPPTSPVDTAGPQQHPPALPSLNSYHQFQARRQHDLDDLEAARNGGADAMMRGNGQYSRAQGYERMSAYRQQRRAPAAETASAGRLQYLQNSSAPSAPVSSRTAPVVTRTQIQAFEAPENLPPLRSNTPLDYIQREQSWDGQEDHYAPTELHFDEAPITTASLAGAATAALARGNRYHETDDRPSITGPPSYTSQKPPNATRAYISPEHNNNPPTNLLPTALPPTLLPTSHSRHNSTLSSSTISRSRSPLRSGYEYTRGHSPLRALRSEHSHSLHSSRRPSISIPAPSLETPNRTTALGAIDPMDIADDDDNDDPFATLQPQPHAGKRGLGMGLGRFPVAARPGSAASGFLRGFGSGSGSYGQIPTSSPGKSFPGTGAGTVADADTDGPKSEWLSRQTRGNNRLKWLVGIGVTLVVVLVVVGIVVAPVVKRQLEGSSSSSSS